MDTEIEAVKEKIKQVLENIDNVEQKLEAVIDVAKITYWLKKAGKGDIHVDQRIATTKKEHLLRTFGRAQRAKRCIFI